MENEKPWYKKLAEALAPGKVVQASPKSYTQKIAETQYDKDMKLSKEERVKKFKKGFFGE